MDRHGIGGIDGRNSGRGGVGVLLNPSPMHSGMLLPVSWSALFPIQKAFRGERLHSHNPGIHGIRTRSTTQLHLPLLFSLATGKSCCCTHSIHTQTISLRFTSERRKLNVFDTPPNSARHPRAAIPSSKHGLTAKSTVFLMETTS